MSLATERRAARERALGLLYEAEAKGSTGAEVLAGLPVAADEFAEALVLAVDEHGARIDGLLERFAEGWTLTRMAALDRAALRMGSAELIARPDVPTGVVLAETVELASRFSTDASGRFVNGLLARIAEEVRGAATTDALVLDEDDTEPLAPTVDGVITDLDGVIRHWDASHATEADARLGLPVGTIAEAALDADRLAQVTDGRLSFDAWCEAVGQAVAAAHDVDATDVAGVWATATWRIDLSVLELLEAVRDVAPVALLSNASSNLQLDLERSGISDAFDAVVGSADIRVAKPSADAFQTAADRIGVRLDRALFIDDTLSHVEAARALGMRAEVFTGVDDLRELLRELDLLR
ncbi:MAG: transcription antitermination factor NusB [Acidimicrobiales bacterium]